MAKVALIQRELKRDRLVAKYAKKHAELKALAGNAKKTDEERSAARLALQKLPRVHLHRSLLRDLMTARE